MQVKDLTQADVGKWVTLRGQITGVTALSDGFHNAFIHIDGNLDCDGFQRLSAVWHNTILEFTDPPAPVQEVGDVFSHYLHSDEGWTIAAIAGDICLLTYGSNRHTSSVYPLHDGWTFVRKGTQS